MSLVNADYLQGDSEHNILRKMLLRLNTGLIVDDIHLQDVTIANPILVKQVGGDIWNVAVTNTVPVSGTVAVSNFPVTQPVSGTVAVSNFPVTQPVSGTVAVSNFPATQPVSIASTVAVTMPDTQDAFSRLRVATPTYVFDSQLTYNIPPLVYEQITSGTGAAIAHDTTNRCATLTFASTPTGGQSILQTFEHFRYQPGRAQEIFVTFNFISTAANCTKFVGYSDGTNGIELQQAGTTVQLAILSTTGNGNQTVAQASWNVDKLDGTGVSGLTLDLTKSQILVIDLQALYTGRVRVGFDIGGKIIPAHQFNHSNSSTVPYINCANLPIRAGMTCTGTVSTTMRFICASVSSNGGQEDLPGASLTVEGTVTAGNGSATHALSLRPRATFGGVTNRAKFVVDSIEVTVTGANPVRWELVLGQAISGTTAFTDVNTTFSAFEFNTAGTISGTPTVSLLSGYVASGAQTKSSTSSAFNNKYPITLNAAGAARANGTISVIATGITGTSAMRVSINWREIR